MPNTNHFNRVVEAAYRRDWYTTGDAARALHVTREGVRHLAREGKLTFTRTPSGLRMFQEGAVLELAAQRTRARLRSVRALRPKKVGVRGGPRQLSFFGPPFRLVQGGASLDKCQVDRARPLNEIVGSDNGGSVALRAAGGRR